MTLVDAHLHIWDPVRGDYGWIEPGSALDRCFTLADARHALDPGVSVILVQAAPTEAETAFLMQAARQSGGRVAGVIGWLPLDAPDAPERIIQAARQPGLVGLRPMLQDLDDRTWILDPTLRSALDTMAKAGLTLDLLLRADQIVWLPSFAAAYPQLDMVLDYAGKPPFGKPLMDDWKASLARCAGSANLACKLSGLASEAPANWSKETLSPVVAHMIHIFGTRRLIWGSDWPLVEMAGGVRRWADATKWLLDGLAPAERDAVLWGNAWRVYRLDERGFEAARAATDQ